MSSQTLIDACVEISADDLHLFEIVTRVAEPRRPLETNFDLPFVLDVKRLPTQPDRSVIDTTTTSLEQLLSQMHQSQYLPRDVSDAVSWVRDASHPCLVTSKDILPLQDVMNRNFNLILWKTNLSVMQSPSFTKGHFHLPPVLNLLCSGGTKIFFMFAPHPKLSSCQPLSLKAMMTHARTNNVRIQWSVVDATHGLFFPPMWWHAVCNTGCREVVMLAC